MASIYVKTAASVISVSENWSGWLGSDTISTSTWTAPTGITAATGSKTTTVATTTISSGTAGNEYEIVNKIVTAAGLTNERSIYVKIPSANLYCTLAEVKQELDIGQAEWNETADATLLESIEDAVAYIDQETGYTWAVSADSTHYYDAVRDVDGDNLLLRRPFISITSVTNGDGVAVTSDQYITYRPADNTPFFELHLLASADIYWTYTTDHENAITVVGKQGWATTAPTDIRRACKALAAYYYRRRNDTEDSDRAFIAGNTTILQPRIPAEVNDILKRRTRLVAGEGR